jgi:hypothetical protein
VLDSSSLSDSPNNEDATNGLEVSTLSEALVNKTSYGYPKRTASGVELNRVNLLIAMLERRTKLNLQESSPSRPAVRPANHN